MQSLLHLPFKFIGRRLTALCLVLRPSVILGLNLMRATESKISTRLEAEKFDQSLNQYRLEHHIHKWPFISLEEAFVALESGLVDGRFFSAFFDICLQDIALQRDLKIIRDETNREYSGGEMEGFFSLRMGRYIAASNAAFRFRAMWDKLMGLMVLLHWSDEYKRFSGARSRLKEFKRIAKRWNIDTKENQNASIEEWNKKWNQRLENIEKIIREIDDNFRTAETHGVGRLSKWAFEKQKDEDDPFEELLLASNDLYEHLGNLSSVLRLMTARK